MWQHFQSKKFVAYLVAFVEGSLVLVVAAARDRYAPGVISDHVLETAIAAVVIKAVAMILGQSYADAATDGKTSGVANATFGQAVSAITDAAIAKALSTAPAATPAAPLPPLARS